ncbi:hypothetical protein EV426DRAFT_713480, partial [Tirmania nivea]
MPYSLYLDIDSPTLAQTFAYEGYSSSNASATKSTFSELSPQRWPVDFSTANLDFDFDPDDEENPFVFDIEASSKGITLPAPAPLSPMGTVTTRSRASPLLAPGIRSGPLSYYESIFGHGHGLVDESKSPETHVTIETDDHSEDSEDEMTTAQVSPLAPSIECFRMATFDRPVRDLPPTHPPTPAMQKFQISVNSHSQPETSDLNFSPAPSLDSDSIASSPRTVGAVVNNESLRSQLGSIDAENNVDMGIMHSPSTLLLRHSAFSLSSDEESHFEYNEHRSSYGEDRLTTYTKGRCSDNGGDEGPNRDVDHVSADELNLSSEHEIMYHGREISGYYENTTHYASDEDGAHAKEEAPLNSNTYSISDCHD